MPDVNIGIWGGIRSGKTTYLGALGIAATLDSTGQWRVIGQDSQRPGSTNFLTTSTNMMLINRDFPPTSVSPAQYAYRITGHPHQAMWGHIRDGIFRRQSELNFILNFQDRPGGDYLVTDHQDPLWAHLAGCGGLIYLYDPLVEGYENYRYLVGALSFLFQKIESESRLIKGKLPHYIAICLSKYDDPKVYDKLRQNGLIKVETQRSVETPVVTNARQAFDLFSDRMTGPTLENYFLQDRIQYFATSSIGFYTHPQGKHKPDDCHNTTVTPSGLKIRGDATPINVFTPFVWIAGRAS